MCLIWFSYQNISGYRLIVAANRDEFLDRPTQPLAWRGDILAGWDERGGGTWLGVNRQGKLAALTNYRDPSRLKENPPSRGEIIANYLRSEQSAGAFLEESRQKAGRYNPFSLLLFDDGNFFSFSNIDGQIVAIEPGVHALSNSLLDADWPKTRRVRELMAKMAGTGEAENRSPCRHETRHEIVGEGRQSANTMIDPEPFFAALRDRHQARDEELPRTGVGMEWERILAPIFVVSEGYGTRSSAFVAWRDDGRIDFYERSYW